MKQLRKHLTFANAISCVALFVALSGAAYAAKVTLGNKAVKTRNLANGAVSTLKLRSGAVTTLKLRNGAVTGVKIAPGAVGSTQLADGGVRSVDLGGGVVTEGKLKNGSVTESKIFNSAVTNSKIAPNAVATGKIADGAVTSAKLASAFFAQLVKNVTYVSKASGAVSTTTPQSVAAECPADKQAIGGGAKLIAGESTTDQITESVLFLAADGKRTGWTAAARATDGKTFAVEAVAICAEF